MWSADTIYYICHYVKPTTHDNCSEHTTAAPVYCTPSPSVAHQSDQPNPFHLGATHLAAIRRALIALTCAWHQLHQIGAALAHLSVTYPDRRARDLCKSYLTLRVRVSAVDVRINNHPLCTHAQQQRSTCSINQTGGRWVRRTVVTVASSTPRMHSPTTITVLFV